MHEGDRVRANNAWPAINIEFSEDKGQSWQPYKIPLQKRGELWFRSRSQTDQYSRVIRLTNPNDSETLN